jgi:DNA-3-methyladenine glycosylase I
MRVFKQKCLKTSMNTALIALIPSSKMPLSLIKHADGKHRCSWCGQLPDYTAYHDDEWGHPVTDDKRLFEKITLEGFQSGLSWLTILRKRDAFRQVFAGFDFVKVARFTPKDVEHLLQNAGIVRHRGKIESAINNAQRVCELVEQEGSLAKFVWQFEPAAASRPKRITPEIAGTLTQCDESVALSKALKKRGFSFVGPTTMYAFMQSMGLINDHLHGCHARKVVEQKRAAQRDVKLV